MKNAFLSALLFACIIANAQTNAKVSETDSVEVQLLLLPDSTGIGTPIGKKVSKEIGTAGGRVISDDGKVELHFPADALNKATEISIQPIKNGIPNSNKSYQFEPSGIQFQKPVQIIFHCSNEEAEICPPEFKFMAMQDQRGKWEYLGYDDWDSTTKSLKGTISHFSAFVDGNEVELSAKEKTMKVGKSLPLSLNIVQPPPAAAAEGEDELPMLPVTMRRNNHEVLWKVNRQTGGDARHGTITSLPGQAIKATYNAPSVLTADSIKVKLELNDVQLEEIISRTGRRGRMTRIARLVSNVATFTCKVNLYDEYKVTVSQKVKEDGWEMTDTSVFRLRVSIEDRVSISDIYNQLAKVYIPQGRCRAVYANASTCVGMINVSGIRTSNVMPTPDGYVKVDIFFKPAALVFPVIHFPPCGNNRASNTTPPAVTPNAFPMWLSFVAKNEKQYISLQTGSEVQRPKPDDITATIEPIRD